MKTKTSDAQRTAIAANLDVLRLRLAVAAGLVAEACTAMAAGQQNQAIGTIIDLEQGLPECDALLRATLVLHRMRTLNLQEGGAP